MVHSWKMFHKTSSWAQGHHAEYCIEDGWACYSAGSLCYTSSLILDDVYTCKMEWATATLISEKKWI